MKIPSIQPNKTRGSVISRHFLLSLSSKKTWALHLTKKSNMRTKFAQFITDKWALTSLFESEVGTIKLHINKKKKKLHPFSSGRRVREVTRFNLSNASDEIQKNKEIKATLQISSQIEKEHAQCGEVVGEAASGPDLKCCITSVPSYTLPFPDLSQASSLH